MRRLILFLALVLISSRGFCQLSVGIAAGYTNNSLAADGGYYDREYFNKGGYSVAIPVQYDIKEWLAVRGELGYAKKSYNSTFYGENTNNERIVVQDSNYSNGYAQLPIMASLSIGSEKLRAFINLGGYVGLWTSSNISGSNINGLNGVYESFDYKYEFNSQTDNQFDAGVLCGIGLRYLLTDQIGIFAEGRYLHGLTNMQKDYMYELYPRYNQTIAVQVGVTYNFKLRNR